MRFALVLCCLGALLGGAGGQTFQISELVARNESSRRDAEADYSDWIEIRNTGKNSASLAGWHLTDSPDRLRKWTFPDIVVEPGGFLVVTADDDPAKGTLDASFSLDAGGEYLALVTPDGKVSDQLAPAFPPQLPDIAWGRAGGGDGWDYLAPTPGEANGNPLPELPPRIWQLTGNPDMPGPGEAISVRALVSSLRAGREITAVKLFYRNGFDDEQSIPMVRDTAPGAEADRFVAIIPGDALAAGAMIRWRVEATAANGETAREPPHRLARDSPEYHGTVVKDPAIDTRLPVLHWFVERPARADTRSGTQASVFYRGRFYDNIFCRTRGQSTANREKPKYKFDFHKGHHFLVSDELPKVEEFNLNSFLRGQTREPAMFTYLNDAGTLAPHTFYLEVRQNGGYHGLFGYVEQVDKRFLRRHGFDATGPLYKAAQVPATMNRNPTSALYEKHLRKQEPYTDLRDLANGINAGNDDRFAFFADNVNVPNYLNVMAAMMVPFNHDQLTKNYYLYRDPHRGEWFRFPWDADQAFPTGRANTLENWTSPLYGDREHTQELLNDRPNPVWQNHLHANILDNPVTREMYLRRVRTLMDTYLALDPPEPEVVWLSGDKGVTSVRYRVPADGSLDGLWQARDFDDSAWLQGALGLGFETIGQEFDALIDTRVRPFETNPAATSIYLRIPFAVPDPRAVTHWSLRMKYDDGFVAYLNGIEVARANITGEPAWNTRAASHPDDEALEYEAFPLDAFAGALVEGENMLAIQIANVSAPSSDLLVVAEVVSGNPESSGYFERLFQRIEDGIAGDAEADRQHWRTRGVSIPTLSSDIRSAVGRGGSLERRREQLFVDYASGPDRLIPEPQPAGVTLEFGRIDANPAAGGQDAEYLELINPNAFAVDLSGWRLAGGVQWTLPPGTVIASSIHAGTGQNRLYLSPNVSAFRGRADFPLAGGSRFVAGNYSGHLSNFGETVTLTDLDGHLAASVKTPTVPTDPQRFLRITEIMYHPADPHDTAEFIELTNTSDVVTLNLEGVRFTEGIRFTFPARQLAPGESIVLVEDASAFEAAHGAAAAAHVAGTFADGTGLANGGESLKLDDADGSTIVAVAYSDRLPWPEAADGGGASLQLASPGRPDDPLAWLASPAEGGDPGAFAPQRFQGDPALDADGDGLGALLEFAAGTSDADASDTGAPLRIMASRPDAVEFAVQRSLSAFVETRVEYSRNLQAWNRADPAVNLVERKPLPASGIERLLYAVDRQGIDSSNGFLYLRLVASP